MSHVRVYHSPVGSGSKNPFERPCDCKMRAKRLIIRDKRRPGSVYTTISYAIFKQLARKSNAWHKVEETQSICWLP